MTDAATAPEPTASEPTASEPTAPEATGPEPTAPEPTGATDHKGEPPGGESGPSDGSSWNEHIAQQAATGISSPDADEHAGTEAPASEGQLPA